MSQVLVVYLICRRLEQKSWLSQLAYVLGLGGLLVYYSSVGFFFLSITFIQSRWDLNTRFSEKCAAVVLVNSCLNTGMAAAV